MTAAGHLVGLAVGSFLIGWLFFYLWPRARRDKLRLDLFTIRNDLFQFMWENGYPFSNEAYRACRESLNQNIRWSNRLNIGTFFVAIIMPDRPDRVDVGKLISKEADPHLRQALEGARTKAGIRLATFLLTGFGGVLTLLLVIPVLILCQKVKNVLTSLSKLGNAILELLEKAENRELQAHSIHH